MSQKEEKIFFILDGGLIEALLACDQGELGKKIAVFFASLASNGFVYLAEMTDGYLAIIYHKDLDKLVAYKGTGQDCEWDMVGQPEKISAEEACQF